MPRGRALAGAAGALAACAFLASCHVPGFAVAHPADAQAQQAARLWDRTQFVALGVGIVVWGLIAWVVLRYRRRRGASPTFPSQKASNLGIEVVTIAIPLLIVVALFVLTTIAQRRMTAVSTHPDLRVEATAFQWGWRFHYPVGGVTTASGGAPGVVAGGAAVLGGRPPELVLPLGQTAEIDLSATDVVHAFYVPELLFQRNAVPGAPTRFDITPTSLGTFGGKCSTFCGIRHASMTFTVRVISPEDFGRWLASEGEPG